MIEKTLLQIEIEKINDAHALKMSHLQLEADMESHKSRARALTVGTSFGGQVEVIMRKFDGGIIWATLTPAEVVEFINQMAAGIGCHIHIQPRNDFCSWRNWRISEDDKRKLGPWVKHSEDPEKSIGFSTKLSEEEIKELHARFEKLEREKLEIGTE